MLLLMDAGHSTDSQGSVGTDHSYGRQQRPKLFFFRNRRPSASRGLQPTLGGINPTGFGFDWGLPFFYGVRIYNAIDGQSVPSGAPAAHWWAF